MINTLLNKLWTLSPELYIKHKAAGNGFGYGIATRRNFTYIERRTIIRMGLRFLIAQGRKNPRRLTPRECARLQGFPDDFKIVVSDTQAYKQFGNSVVPSGSA